MKQNTHHRPAVTLMEVLIAIFILALGMLSVMAFFPVGAMNMVRAVKDERCAQAASNADVVMRNVWKGAYQNTDGTIRELVGDSGESQTFFSEPALLAMDFPSLTGPFASPAQVSALIVSDPTNGPAYQAQRRNPGPSNPVLIDPIGWNVRGGSSDQNFVANLPWLPRRTLQANTGGPLPPILATRMATLLDDIGYTEDGLPDTSAGQVDRGSRYNVTWMLQRKQNSNRSEVNMTILVFDGRPVSDIPAQELPYSVNVTNPISNEVNTVTIDITPTGRPPLRKGTWVMLTASTAEGAPQPITDFYRVTSLDERDNGSQKLLDIGIYPPLRRYNMPGGVTAPPNYLARIIVMEHLAEVFDRGTISARANVGD
ncbi:MAG: hypothetical protein R3B84_17090 [Zavarzinella sp.]